MLAMRVALSDTHTQVYNHLRGTRLPGDNGVYIMHRLLCNVLPREREYYPELAGVELSDLVWVKWTGWEEERDCTIERISEISHSVPSAVHLYTMRRNLLLEGLDVRAPDVDECLRARFLCDAEGLQVGIALAPIFCRVELDLLHRAAAPLRKLKPAVAGVVRGDGDEECDSDYTDVDDEAPGVGVPGSRKRASGVIDADTMRSLVDRASKRLFAKTMGSKAKAPVLFHRVASIHPRPCATHSASEEPPAAAAAAAPTPLFAFAAAAPPPLPSPHPPLPPHHPHLPMPFATAAAAAAAEEVPAVIVPGTPPPAPRREAPGAPKRFVPPSAKILGLGFRPRSVHQAATAIANSVVTAVLSRMSQLPNELNTCAASLVSGTSQFHALVDRVSTTLTTKKQ